MPESIARHDFFISDSAREAGLTQSFWHQAYMMFIKEAEENTSLPAFGIYEIARVVRIPFGPGYLNVLVRCQPDPREHRIYRLTTFAADVERQPLDVNTAFEQLLEGRAMLGEAVLMDRGRRW